jgi:hypothetical protein
MPSSPTDAAFECMFLVDDALTHYVAIHDRIFDQQATAMSVVRNLFGGGPDFAKLHAEAKAADELWSTVEEHVEECVTVFQSGFSPRERAFFIALVPYVKAVKRTTTLLRNRQEALLSKLQGPLSLSEYQRIEREYANAAETYVRLGALLQPLSEQLFDKNA